MKNAAPAILVLCLGGGYAALAISSLRTTSAVFDECAALPAGYTHLARGDYRLMIEHPPLLKALAALPLTQLDVRVPWDDHAWARRRYFEFGRRLLYEWNDADRLLFWGRLPTVALGVLLAVAVFHWTRSHWGLGAASAALFLCILSPDVLAHGQVATTDVGISLFTFLSVVGLERLAERANWTRLLLVGLALGCALASKFSAVALLPILGMLALVVSRARRPLTLDFQGQTSPRTLTATRMRLLFLGLFFLVIGVVALFVVWCAYGFQARVSPDAAVNSLFDLENERPRNPAVWRATAWINETGILPDGYVYGFLRFYKHSERRRAFLMGQRSSEGWWYYFPVTFAIKTPIPLLLLLGLAIVYLTTSTNRLSLLEAFLWIPVVAYLITAVTRGLNIGHRHLLPVYPFLFVVAGRAAAALWQSRAERYGWRVVRRGVVAALLAAYAFGTLRIHPHYLAYFNELVGGPENGYLYLVDSNLDWGQDLKRLKRFMDARGISRIKLSYFGTAEPSYHGIRCDRLPGYPPPDEMIKRVEPGDLIAVSATNLQAVYLDDDPDAERLMRRLRRLRPIDRIGYSIFIYQADFDWQHP